MGQSFWESGVTNDARPEWPGDRPAAEPAAEAAEPSHASSDLITELRERAAEAAARVAQYSQAGEQPEARAEAVLEQSAEPTVEVEKPVAEPAAEEAEKPSAEPAAEAAEPTEEASDQAVSADDFSALEERIQRTVTLVKRERLARAEAEGRAEAAEVHLREQLPKIENLEKEVSGLRTERDRVRQRVERLLLQLDTLEL
jgi:hypothetical protein